MEEGRSDTPLDFETPKPDQNEQDNQARQYHEELLKQILLENRRKIIENSLAAGTIPLLGAGVGGSVPSMSVDPSFPPAFPPNYLSSEALMLPLLRQSLLMQTKSEEVRVVFENYQREFIRMQAAKFGLPGKSNCYTV